MKGELEGTQLFRIDSKNGLIIKLVSYGAPLLSCQHRSRDGEMEEVTLNRQTLEDLHTRAKNPKYGATCGRVAGRIAGARFTIGETEYELEANNGPNTCHGGTKGYHNCEWSAEIVTEKRLSDYTDLSD